MSSKPKDRADEIASRFGNCTFEGSTWCEKLAAEIRAYGDARAKAEVDAALCETCGWYGKWGGAAGCSFCAVDRLEAALASERKAREQAEAECDRRAEGLEKRIVSERRVLHGVASALGYGFDADGHAPPLPEFARGVKAEADKLREALRATAYVLTEAKRALRAWATPLTGMGSNITQEDRGRTALALREIEKAETQAQERPLTANAWQEQARHLEAQTILAAAIQRAEQAEDRASSAESELARKDVALRRIEELASNHCRQDYREIARIAREALNS